jgi:hypothetical protein
VLESIPPKDYIERGHAFGLDRDTFEQWWAYTVDPKDASEFVHFHHGSLEGARYVCALEELLSREGSAISSDCIVRAYCAAYVMPFESMHDQDVKIQAQLLHQLDSTQWLLDRVHYRNRQQTEARLAAIATRKIEQISQDDDEEPDLKKKQVVIDASLRFLSIQQKERQAEQVRRDKRSHQAMLDRAQTMEKHVEGDPSISEVKQFFVRMKETFGAEAINAIIQEVFPALPAGKADADATHS